MLLPQSVILLPALIASSLHVAVQWQVDFMDTHNHRILYALTLLPSKFGINISLGAFVGALIVGRSGLHMSWLDMGLMEL